MSKEFDDVLSDIQLALAKELLSRIRSGEASAADLNVARQLLKDNHIQDAGGTNAGMDLLRDFVPRFQAGKTLQA